MTSNTKIETASYVLAAFGLYAVLHLGLLSSLLAGLMVFHLVEAGADRVSKFGVAPALGKTLLLILLMIILVGGVSLGAVGIANFVAGGEESVGELLKKMADVVDSARTHVPGWVFDNAPSTLNEWQNASSEWLRENAGRVSMFGRDIAKFLLHVIAGTVIGGLAALGMHKDSHPSAPLAMALGQRLAMLAHGFRQIVFSQIKISTLNTILTAIFLAVILPVVGIKLPLLKTMIAVTFVAGLLPVIGNLISNTVIVLVGLGVSLPAAGATLLFLVVIHKLEYFVNARIIGSHIKAQAWELLVVMLVMETAFGLSGMIAAPIYYAYLKNELAAKKLI